jgi:hypothetical protein
MSESFLNQVTLDCLLNKNMYNKHLLADKKRHNLKKDKKFYKKRIFNLVKEMLITKEEPSDLCPDVKYTFDNFVESAIHYFKSKDNNDLIQSEYNNIEETPVINSDLLELNIDSPLTEKDANELLMRSFKITKPSLDNFVTIKYTKPLHDIILPKQKDINLTDPVLRNKGIIRKKKNIINKYDENINSKKEITETSDKEK